jgi:hypothetical protein
MIACLSRDIENQLVIAPVIKQLNFKRQSSIKPNAGKGFDDSATKCFRYFATGSITSLMTYLLLGDTNRLLTEKETMK